MEKLSCAVTFDFDGLSSWVGDPDANFCTVSRGQFGAVALSRILALLERYEVRSSFAVPGHTAYAWPNLVKQIHECGHELIHHGWVHENPADFDESGERSNLEKGLEALHRVTGVRPMGYRSPGWSFSRHTVELLIEYGFLYDSSCMGHDFCPYYLRRGDQWSKDSAYRFGTVTELIELPVNWGLDDFPVFEFVPGFNEGLKPPSAVEEIWRGEFDYARAHCTGGIFNLTLHPQTIGRGHRLLMLERLLDYFSSAGVKFEPLADYARRWKKANPLKKWIKDNPDLAGTHAINP